MASRKVRQEKNDRTWGQDTFQATKVDPEAPRCASVPRLLAYQTSRSYAHAICGQIREEVMKFLVTLVLAASLVVACVTTVILPTPASAHCTIGNCK